MHTYQVDLRLNRHFQLRVTELTLLEKLKTTSSPTVIGDRIDPAKLSYSAPTSASATHRNADQERFSRTRNQPLSRHQSKSDSPRVRQKMGLECYSKERPNNRADFGRDAKYGFVVCYATRNGHSQYELGPSKPHCSDYRGNIQRPKYTNRRVCCLENNSQPPTWSIIGWSDWFRLLHRRKHNFHNFVRIDQWASGKRPSHPRRLCRGTHSLAMD